MSYHGDSTASTYSAPQAAERVCTVRVRRAVILFVLAGLLVVPLARTGEEKPVAVALILALGVTLGVALHRPGPQRV